MSYLLLLLLILACLWTNWPQPLEWVGHPVARPFLFAVLSWSIVLSTVAVAVWISRSTRRRLQKHPFNTESVLSRFQSLRLYHLLGQFGVYAFVLFVLGWGWTVQHLGMAVDSGPGRMLPGAELLLFAPLLATLLLSWAVFYDAERALHDTALPPAPGSPFWSRWAYVGFHLRQNLALVSVPVGLLIAVNALRWLFRDPEDDQLFQIIMACLLLAAFVCLPLVLRLVLRLKPLPEGPLRRHLLDAGRRLNFRCSNILVWNTHGGVANAMVAGLLPWLRYVVFTDRLMHELTVEELEAVFGHEIGHVKHRHMLYYVGFLLLSVAILACVSTLLPINSLLDTRSDLALFPLLTIVGAYIFVVFGFLSRRCERQADVFGCRAVSCGRKDCAGHDPSTALVPGGRGLCPTGIQTFIDALERVAWVNGTSRRKPGWLASWQHSTIARRVEFLEAVATDLSLERRFQRRVTLVKWAMLLGLVVVLVALARLQGDWSQMRLF